MTLALTYAIDEPCALRQGADEAAFLARALAPGGALSVAAGAACATCEANVEARGAGCSGTVDLPLTPEDEAWLLGRLPRDLETTAGYVLASALGDFGWDGGYAAQLRRADAERAARGERPRHFVSPTPLRRVDGLPIDANQVFDILFGEGHVRPEHPLLVVLCFGLVPHTTSPPDLARFRREPATLAPHLTLPAPTHALARALRAFAVAATRGRQLLVAR